MFSKNRVFVILIMIALLFSGGCVKRNLHIMTDPPGAQVYFNDAPTGVTPLDYDFIWYAEHKVRIEKEGYETLESIEDIPPPSKFWWLTDLFLELMPRDFWDRRELSYTLVPLQEE